MVLLLFQAMKRMFILLIALMFGACATQDAESQKIVPAPPKPKTVIVELFTSEGCSSCPAAERGLEFLHREQPVPTAEIVPLALHVDYWDGLGWKDPFASRLFTNRQEIYIERFKRDSAYTPQFVIDGKYEVTGGDTGSATRLIENAAKNPTAAVDATVRDGNVSIRIGNVPVHDDATVFIAIVENRIEREIGGGENRGRKLVHNFVVRKLSAVGKIGSNQSSAEFESALDLAGVASKASTEIVVFVQENRTRAIIGGVKVMLE